MHAKLPYEVVKKVGGRSYRYRVESYRDPETGKPKGRWTYLGRVGPDGSAQAEGARVRTRGDTTATRERLIAALERLLKDHDFADVTANAIAREAGVAHGTFYRYFTDKRDALRAAVGKLAESIELSLTPLSDPLGSRDDERLRLRSLLTTTLTSKAAVPGRENDPGVKRAWVTLVTQDAELAADRLVIRARFAGTIAAYLGRLIEAGYATIDSPAEFGRALFVLLDGAHRTMTLEGRMLDDAEIEAIVTVADRGIFARSD